MDNEILITKINKDRQVSLERYVKWLDKLNVLHGQCYPTSGISKWFTSVKNCHNEVRQLIGGINAGYKININVGQETLSAGKITAYVTKIDLILPRLFSDYMSSATLSLPITKMTTTNDRGEAQRVRELKVSKVIKGYADRNYKLSKEDSLKLETVLGHLGEEWAKLKNVNKTFYVSIHTSPIAFSKIGHFGTDAGSCFAHGRQNWKHKYVLGEKPNTFVLIIKEYSNDGKKISKKVVSRQWGFYNPAEGAINICNMYASGIIPTLVQKINHKLFSFLLNDKETNIKSIPDIINIRQDLIYHNKGKGTDFTFVHKDKAQGIKTQVIV